MAALRRWFVRLVIFAIVYGAGPAPRASADGCLSPQFGPTATTQYIGASIGFWASSYGCVNPLFKFEIWGNTNYYAFQDWSSTASWTWYTEAADAGSTYFKVSVKSANDPNGVVNYSTTTGIVLANGAACNTPTLSPSPASPQSVGTQVTWTAGSASCMYPRYRFWYQNPAGLWVLAQDWSAANTFVWNTTSALAGNYSVELNVRAAYVRSGQDGALTLIDTLGSGPAPDYAWTFPYTFGGDPAGAYAAQGVNVGTGAFSTSATDLSLPGRILPFAFVRSYTSADDRGGPLGPGWTHSFNWKITDGGARLELRQGDGWRDTFVRNADGTYQNPIGIYSRLTKNGDGTYTYKLKSQVSYLFDTTGTLTRISEPSGNHIDLGYSSGLLATITDTVGRQLTLHYTTGLLDTLTDATGRKVTYAYDGQGRLASVVDMYGNAHGASGHTWTYAYAGTSIHLASITDPDAHVRVTNTYDAATGKVTSQVDGESHTTTINGLTVTSPRSLSTTYSLDARKRVLSRSDSATGMSSSSVSYSYDSNGNPLSYTDRSGFQTTYQYDTLGNRTSQSFPYASNGYDANNNLVSSTDGAGYTRTWSYNLSTNLLSSVSVPSSAGTATTSYAYGDATNPGLPTTVTSPRGYATSLHYDSQGNLLWMTDPDGYTTTYTYDTVGRERSWTDGVGTWTMTPDENDRLVSQSDPLTHSESYAYDGSGNRTSVTDKNGHMTTYAYNGNAQLVTTTEHPDGSTTYNTRLTRDADGNVTRVAPDNGTYTDYAYDPLGRATGFTEYPSASAAWTFAPDGEGRMTSRTAPDGTSAGLSYNSNGTLAYANTGSISYPAPLYSDPGHYRGYGYDGRQLVTSVSESAGGSNWSATYTRDGRGQVTSYQTFYGMTAAYDLDGDRTQIAWHDDEVGDPGEPGHHYWPAQSVGWGYTPGDRLSTVMDWKGWTTSYSYNSRGLVSQIALPTGLTTTFTYDNAQRLTDVVNKVGATTLSSHHYTLDNVGNRIQLDEFVSGIDSTTKTFYFGYDWMNRLTSVSGAKSETFAYDGAGNITSRTGPSATYTYDGANRLTADGTRTFQWTGADRELYRGNDELRYDGLDELTAFNDTSESLGQRTFSYTDALLTSQSGATYMQWDPTRGLADLVVRGNAVHPQDDDRIIYGRAGEPLYINKADGSAVMLLRDGLGSIRAETNSYNSVLRAFRYAAYGAIDSGSLGQPSILGYAGQVQETPTLVYMRARWYDSTTGRFLTRDRLNDAAVATHPYAYANANPIVNTDPSGRCLPLCLVLLVIGVKAFLTTVDAINTLDTVTDRDASDLEKTTMVGLFAAGLLSEGGEATAGRLAIQATKGQLRHFEKQLAEEGVKSLERSRASLQRRLDEHIEKLAKYRAEGGYTSSVEEEIRNFQGQLDAIDQLLAGRP